MGSKDVNKKPFAAGEEIYRLIPQRPPIVMVDALYEVSETGAVTGLTVLPDNIFVDREQACDSEPGSDVGRLTESGVIEHVAQSAAVFNGYWAVVRGVEPSLGYIAEIKKFRILSLPPVGSQLRTELEVLNDFGGMMLLSATVSCDNEIIAQGQMKLFIDSKE